MNTKRLKHIAIGLTGLSIALSGCGGTNKSVGDETTAQMLVPAGSSSDFAEHVKSSFRELGSLSATRDNNSSNEAVSVRDSAELADDGLSAVSESGYSAEDNSITNLIEAGVDEADLMKFDGQYIFTVEQPDSYSGWYCEICFFDAGFIGVAVEGTSTDIAELSAISDETSLPYFTQYSPPAEPAKIHVHSASKDPASAEWVGSLALSENGMTTRGLYLDGDRDSNSMQIISVNSSYSHGWERWTNNEVWQGGKTSLHFINANDPSEMTETEKLEWQGYYIDSRVVEGVLYVVTRHTPKVDGFVYYPQNETQERDNVALIDSLDVNDILPSLIINDSNETTLVAGENCFVPEQNGAEFWPSIITITAVTLSNPTEPSSSCAMASGAGLYASTEALYLTQSQYSDDSNKTQIHKFALSSTGATYRGSGEVEGYLGWGGNSAFRMSEKDGEFRILTTTGSWGDFKHHLTILVEEDGPSDTDTLALRNLGLKTIARIPNESRPDAIGKPGEDVYGVRFLGDKAYVVTFQRTDPLYVLDLSDSNDPFIAGEVEIPGFSEYLQLLDEDSLLGIGRSANNEAQVSLFDVSDAANPLLVNTAVAGTYTSATYDYHSIAWVYNADSAETKFTFPVTRYSNGDWNNQQTGLAFFTIDTLNNRFNTEGFMAVFEGNSGAWLYGAGNWQSSPRTLIQGDALHYVNEHLVWSASQSALSEVVGPQGKWAYGLNMTSLIEDVTSTSVSEPQISLEDDHLLLSFMTSACSGDWLFYVGTSFQESEPVQVTAKLNLQRDPLALCAPVISQRTLRFDLDRLKSHYQRSYQTEGGTVQLNIDGIGKIQYTF